MSDNSHAGSRASSKRWLRLGHLQLSDLLVETFSVLLGVLLALLINSYVQERQTRHKVDEAQAGVRDELLANRQRVTTMSEYYHHIDELINAAMTGTHPPAHCDDIPQWKGLLTPLFVRAAYDTATTSGVFADATFESTRRIANLYAELSRLEAFSGKVEDWMMAQMIANHAQRSDIVMCRSFLKDLEYSTQQVQKDLDAYLGTTTPGLNTHP